MYSLYACIAGCPAEAIEYGKKRRVSQDIILERSKLASNANMYMFTILAGFLPAKTLADGYPLIPQDVPFGDGCASCGL